MCKHLELKHDKYGYIYKCKLISEPNQIVFAIKQSFEEKFPGKTFSAQGGVCYYAYDHNESICPYYEKKA